jgi:hypothetical protein
MVSPRLRPWSRMVSKSVGLEKCRSAVGRRPSSFEFRVFGPGIFRPKKVPDSLVLGFQFRKSVGPPWGVDFWVFEKCPIPPSQGLPVARMEGRAATQETMVSYGHAQVATMVAHGHAQVATMHDHGLIWSCPGCDHGHAWSCPGCDHA